MKTELHIPSDLKFLTIAEDWLLGSLKLEVGDTVDWTKQSSRFRLALVEAYSNVVRHAHRAQPELPVLMRLEVQDQDMALEVWDLGVGYDPGDYRTPTPEDKQEHGYGWMILNRLMDRVEYQLQIDGRNCLKLEANLPSVLKETA
ncbi:MAG: anti-sigma regulatory factor [Alkalinema sp. RU_4_3]|nr:anti-sigma regulatory factor [Alkalinema sp. RU_4_3]